jgi:hypothetical protein
MDKKALRKKSNSEKGSLLSATQNLQEEKCHSRQQL